MPRHYRNEPTVPLSPYVNVHTAESHTGRTVVIAIAVAAVLSVPAFALGALFGTLPF